jgi:hypothetical protein
MHGSRRKLQYIVRAPTTGHYTPPGRATRGFEAYDVQRCKDTWRVDLPGIEIEGETYQLLQEAHVINLAVCFAAGDILDHTTQTHHYKDKEWACGTVHPLVPHRHYRLVLDTIGQSLMSFGSSSEMLLSVLHAVECMCFTFISSGQSLISDIFRPSRRSCSRGTSP